MLAEELAKPSYPRRIKASAKEWQIWVGVGVHETADEKRCYNTNLVSFLIPLI